MSQEGDDIYSSLNIVLPKTPNTTPRTPTNPDEFVDVSPISNYTGDTLTSEPQTPEEIELYEGALRRRQLRLVLAKRMDPKDAVELKSIFGLEEQSNIK